MLSASKKIFLHCLIATNMSPILWYDLRILTARGNNLPFSFEQTLLLWAVLMLPFTVILLLYLVIRFRLHFLVIWLILYIVSSTIVGFEAGNSTIYLAGDLYKALILLSGFGMAFYFYEFREYIVRTICFYGGLLIFLRFVYFLSFVGDPFALYYGNVMDVIFIACILGLQPRLRLFTSRIKHSIWSLLNLIIMFLIFLGMKKAVVLSAVFTIMIRMLSPVRIFLGVAGLMIIYILFAQQIFDAMSGNRLESLFSLETLIETEAQRLSEIQISFERWISSPFRIAFGSGFGTEIFSYSQKEASFEYVHSIHNSIAATGVRSGLVGLLFIVFAVGYSLLGLLHRDTRNDAIVVLTVFVVCQFVYTFMDELFVGFFLGNIICFRSALKVQRRLPKP